jgi:hypothetical protein
LVGLASDLCGGLLAAATLQIQTRSEQRRGGGLGHGVVTSRDFKLDAVVPEVTIRIESKGNVVSALGSKR